MQPTILLIDNYDSFVHNLARYLRELGCRTETLRNDHRSVLELSFPQPAAVVLSPGPCSPAEAEGSVNLVRQLESTVPMLGVCLGMQILAAAFGGRVVRAREPIHGRTSFIEHSGHGLFEGQPRPLRATRYHSLVVDEDSLPKEFSITARLQDGVPMAMEHRSQLLFGLQFHPESILTTAGHQLLGNFLTLAGLAPGLNLNREWEERPREPVPNGPAEPVVSQPVFW